MFDYLRVNLLDRTTLEVKDFATIVNAKLNVDKLTNNISTITPAGIKEVNAKNNDIVYIVDQDNKQIFLGKLSNTLIDRNTEIVKLNAQIFDTFFDREIIVPDNYSGNIEDLLITLITDNFISSSDALANVSYFTFNKLTNTPVILSYDQTNQKLSDLLIEWFTKYRLNLDYTIRNNKSEIQITISTASINKTLELGASDIQNLNINRTEQQTLNKLEFYPLPENVVNTTTEIYYLLSDNTITQNAADPKRITPINNKILFYEDGADLDALSKQELQGGIYNHLIEFDLKDESKIIRIFTDFNINDQLKLIDNDVTYESILTGYTLSTGNNFIKLTFGMVRINLTDKLRRL